LKRTPQNELPLAVGGDFVGQVDISLVVDIEEGIELRVEFSEPSFIQVQHVHFFEDVDDAVAVGLQVFFIVCRQDNE